MILTAIIMILLYLLGCFMPIFAFLLPGYQLKQYSRIGAKKSILIQVVFFVGLLAFQRELAFIYLAFTGMTVVLYVLLDGVEVEIRTFDAILVTAMSSVAVAMASFYAFKGDYAVSYEAAMQLWQQQYQLSYVEIQSIHKYMLEYYPTMLLHYGIFVAYCAYWMRDGMKGYAAWTISPTWILGFAFAVLAGYIFGDQNFYVVNAIEMSKAIFIWFAINGLYGLFQHKVEKFRYIYIAGTFLLGMQFPNAMFVAGGLFALLDAWTKKRIEERVLQAKTTTMLDEFAKNKDEETEKEEEKENKKK